MSILVDVRRQSEIGATHSGDWSWLERRGWASIVAIPEDLPTIARGSDHILVTIKVEVCGEYRMGARQVRIERNGTLESHPCAGERITIRNPCRRRRW
jgi:hypothetical protein